jgi:glycosyltransferase involved in cell wall biosynthesis
MHYTLIIPAFNEEALLPSTLASVRSAMQDCSYPGELVVVDNNSTDQTGEVARVGGARVVFEAHNQISRARNAGARASRGEALVFLDADTRLPPQLLQRALDRLAGGMCCGGGAGVVFDRPTAIAERGVRLWARISRRFHLAAGSFVFCLREGFDAVGGFNESVYAGEEIWLSRAMGRWGKARGMSFEVLGDAPVVTSARKLEWHSQFYILGYTFLMMLFPFMTRYRALCAPWYRRPDHAQPAKGKAGEQGK